MPLPTVEELGPRFADFVARLKRPLIFFDTETTGTDPANDRVVEISMIKISPGEGISPPRTWRINPNVRIPLEASEIHGIYNKDVADKPNFAQAADELLAFLAGCDIAGFNIGRFDIRVLQTEFMRCGKLFDLSGVRIIDAQVIYHQKEPRSLTAAMRFYRDKEFKDAHGAEADTVATVEVFAGQLERYGELALEVDALHEVSNAVNNGYVDLSRRFSWRDNEPVFNFGKLKGKSLRWAASEPTERTYMRWILDGNFEEDTKLIIREALAGRIRQRVRTARPAPESSDAAAEAS
jgi:DNA polymerase-3 subunit epsilon